MLMVLWQYSIRIKNRGSADGAAAVQYKNCGYADGAAQGTVQETWLC